MTLNHFEIQHARPREKPYKIFDGAGLFLIIQPNGSKLCPTVTLADARARRDEAKKLLAAGTDPSVRKKLDRINAATAARNTFGLVAAEGRVLDAIQGQALSTVAEGMEC